MKRAAIALMLVVCTLAAAQTRPANPDTVSRAEVVLAARQALEAASRNLGHWLTTVIIVALFAAVLAVWRIWALGRRLSRLEDMRAAWDTRFAGTTDEVLRLKRKLAEAESRADRLENDIAALRPAEPDAATAQVAMVQTELIALRERLDQAEEKLDAVVDHTVVTKQERAAVEELVRTAGQAQVAAEAAANRAEGIAKRAEATDALRTGDERLARQQYPAAVQAYASCLESLGGSGSDDPVSRFRAFHSRAVANLRQREFDAVLADAAEIEVLASERAHGAARLLSGVARLWQGAVPQALQDFSIAVERDAGARAAILRDEDIAAWVKTNPRKAGPVKRFMRELRRDPKGPSRM
jgi:hypothetical protein